MPTTNTTTQTTGRRIITDSDMTSKQYNNIDKVVTLIRSIKVGYTSELYGITVTRRSNGTAELDTIDGRNTQTEYECARDLMVRSGAFRGTESVF